jgi:hypothetical protein
MKAELLRLGAANKRHSFLRVSQRFKSIVNIVREITWQHDTRGPRRHHEWQQLMTTIKESSRVHLTLVYVFHVYASADTPWVAHALSRVSPMRYGRVSSKSATVEASKFAGPKKIPYAPVHNSKLIHLDPTDVSLNQHRWGLPPWSSIYQIRSLILLPIQYSPFFPNCPTRSPIMPTFSWIHLSHIEPLVSRGSYRERLSTTRLIPIAYTTKHSVLSFPSFHWMIKVD